MPVVVCGLGGHGKPGDLPPSILWDRRLHGGERSLHELAVAVAATGRDVELRGRFSPSELDRLTGAAGAGPRIDLAPRAPSPDDVVVVPEGYRRPELYAALSLSEARRVLIALGPPGLTGWPFVPDWSGPRDPLTVDPSAVARPEHFRAIADAGFEIWTHSAGLAEAVRRSGTTVTLLGAGTPVPFPEPGPRPHEVVWVTSNRWAPLARWVVERVGARSFGIPAVPHPRMVEMLGSGRVLAWPCRIEGQARIQIEARAMGTVPVVMRSNRFADGMAEEHGAVVVDSLERMVEETRTLLGDPPRLERLSRRAREWARRHVSWPDYVRRVDRALTEGRGAEPTAASRSWMASIMGSAVERDAARSG